MIVYPVQLDSARLRLREFTSSDVDAVHRIYGDPRATRHLSFEPRSREQVKETVTNAIESARAQTRTEYALAVARLDDADMIGSVRLAIEPHRAGQIGFALRADQWGQGLGTETVKLLLRLGFVDLELHRIWAARSPHNTASAHLLRKAGLHEEGRIRHHVHAHGVWRDSITHSILEHEWHEGPGHAQ